MKIAELQKELYNVIEEAKGDRAVEKEDYAYYAGLAMAVQKLDQYVPADEDL